MRRVHTWKVDGRRRSDKNIVQKCEIKKYPKAIKDVCFLTFFLLCSPLTTLPPSPSLHFNSKLLGRQLAPYVHRFHTYLCSVCTSKYVYGRQEKKIETQNHGLRAIKDKVPKKGLKPPSTILWLNRIRTKRERDIHPFSGKRSHRVVEPVLFFFFRFSSRYYFFETANSRIAHGSVRCRKWNQKEAQWTTSMATTSCGNKMFHSEKWYVRNGWRHNSLDLSSQIRFGIPLKISYSGRYIRRKPTLR